MAEPSSSTSSPSSRPSGWSHNQRVMQRYSCLPCRKRKSKCDRAEPCLSCVLRGSEQYCYTNKEYPPSASANSKSKKDSTNEHHNSIKTHDQKNTAPTTLSHVSVPFAKHSRTNPSSPSYSINNDSGSWRPSKAPRLNSDHALNGDDDMNRLNALRTALNTMTNSLQEVREITNSIHFDSRDTLARCGQMVSWEIVETILPPLEECQEIVHCFFTELEWYQCGTDRESFNISWETMFKDRNPISRQILALICAMIAFTLLLAPQSHPAAKLSEKDQTNPRWQIENSRLLIDAFYYFPSDKYEEDSDDFVNFGSEPELLAQLRAETLFCYYCAVAGLVKKAWFSLGKAIRLGRAVELFDETRWTSKRQDREKKRKIAWDLITMDRWCSLHIGRSGELMAPVNVEYPFVSHPETMIRNLMGELIRKTFEFTQNFQKMDLKKRISAAQTTDAHVQQFYAQLPANLQFENFLESLTALKAESMRHAAPSLTFYFSSNFLRLVIMRPFLMEANAPVELRFGSLRRARSIIESMPHLVSLANNPSVSFPPAWNIQFLFAAAATFASVVLSKDEAESTEMSATPNIEESPYLQFGRKPAKPSDVGFWPEEELEWFASKLFSVVDTFDLVSQGSRGYMAKTLKSLLLALCNSREQLRKRFQEREKQKLNGKRYSYGIVDGKHAQPHKKKSLPSIFSDNVPKRNNLHLSSLQDFVKGTISVDHTTNDSQNRTAEAPFTPNSNFSSSNNSAGDRSSQTYDQQQELGTVSASEVLANMESFGGNSIQGTFYGFNQFNFEVPFLDSQEWANLTSNLNVA